MAIVNRENKEEYRLICRRVLGITDNVDAPEIDALIEHCRQNKIPYPVHWISRRLKYYKEVR